MGVKFMHDCGITHCDLKLENTIMVRTTSEDDTTKRDSYDVKLIDFGLAQRYGEWERGRSPCGETIGTAAYASPEMICLKRSHRKRIYLKDYKNICDTRLNDVWTLGVP
eukprot:UN04142